MLVVQIQTLNQPAEILSKNKSLFFLIWWIIHNSESLIFLLKFLRCFYFFVKAFCGKSKLGSFIVCFFYLNAPIKLNRKRGLYNPTIWWSFEFVMQYWRFYFGQYTFLHYWILTYEKYFQIKQHFSCFY